MSLSFLQNFGLSTHETTVYELLLKQGESTVQILTKQSKLKRTNIYTILASLEEKSLVTKRELSKILHFKPVPPTRLLELADEKYKEIEKSRKDLQAVLPILSSTYILSVEQPIVRMYEGVEGLKEIYFDILKEAKPGFSVLQSEDMDEKLSDFVVNEFSKKRARKRMSLKVIITSGKNAKTFLKNDVKFHRFSKLIPKDLFPFEHEVTIYGDKVAFMHYKKGEKLIGMIIKHPSFAKTMKAFFDLAWQGAEKY